MRKLTRLKVSTTVRKRLKPEMPTDLYKFKNATFIYRQLRISYHPS